MKKIMIALAIVAASVTSQASSYKWSTSAVLNSVNVANVGGNGDYGLGSQAKNNTTLSCILELYSSGELIGASSAVNIKYGTTNAKVNSVQFDVAAGEQGTTYDYIIKITGTDKNLTAKESAEYDYSGAKIATQIAGSIETLPSGTTTLTSGLPTGWTVSGVVAKASPTPEPTSGLLLLLGLAGLALKRRNA